MTSSRKLLAPLVALLLCHGIAQAAEPPTPVVAPGSINNEETAYPYPSSYLPLKLYGQDLRMAYMDVPAAGQANGRTVVLLHGMNFAGFYWSGPIDALRNAGFRVIVPDQIGFGRSSKAIIPYNFHDMARNTQLLLRHLGIARATIIGHSMGGMLAARFATQYPEVAERVVIYNPIGLTDTRFDAPWPSIDEAYERTLASTYQTVRAGLFRYVAHNPAAWNAEFEKYARIRYSWTLGGDWPRYAWVQTLIQRLPYLDPVINDWVHIKSPTLVIGGAEDVLPGSAAVFQERMKFVAASIPGGNGRVVLIPGIGHVPHMEAPQQFYPPLLDFLAK